MDLSGASVNMAGGLSAADEQPHSINAQISAASFDSDLLAAQLVLVPEGLGTSLPDVPLDDLGKSDISEDPSPTELMMWLGVILPLPIEQRPSLTATVTESDSVPLMPNDSNLMSRPVLTHWIEVKQSPASDPREELSADPRPVLIDPVTSDLPTIGSELGFTTDPSSTAILSSLPTNDEGLLVDANLDDMRLPMGDQMPDQPTVDEESQTFAPPASHAENSMTIGRPTGFIAFQPSEVQTNISLAETPSSHSPGDLSVETRTELSEVVRQIRTMVTEHETRSKIQLEPAELGRLTLELVEAHEGLRAYISADDPAVLRFLERNVKLIETEARLHGLAHMSFSVGADVSGGIGHGDQRRSEAEESFRRNIEWNSASQAKPRSRRELDTSA